MILSLLRCCNLFRVQPYVLKFITVFVGHIGVNRRNLSFFISIINFYYIINKLIILVLIHTNLILVHHLKYEFCYGVYNYCKSFICLDLMVKNREVSIERYFKWWTSTKLVWVRYRNY
jgi:hypothetical protein